MTAIIDCANRFQDLLNKFRVFDFLGPLALRLYLAPVFITVGCVKVATFDSVVGWFDTGLGLPFPWLMAFLATATELVGGVLLLLGLATRYVSVPLMITMLVAIFTVHANHGWYAIAPTSSEDHIARPLAALGVESAQQALQNTEEVAERLDRARSLLREHGHYQWLTEKGSFVVLNNGIEFGATYFIMLLMLFFYGAGRFVSLDYWIHRRFRDVQESA